MFFFKAEEVLVLSYEKFYHHNMICYLRIRMVAHSDILSANLSTGIALWRYSFHHVTLFTSEG